MKPFHPGDRVKVVRPIGQVERDELGNTLTFERYGKPHGYAVCRDEISHIQVALHPEALEPVPDPDDEWPGAWDG